MLQVPDHANELRRLRERVYGADAEATADDVARLAEYEASSTTPGSNLAPEPRNEHEPTDPAPDAVPPAGEPARTRPRPLRLLLVAVVVAGSFVAGFLFATPAAPEDFPELLRPQTEEDVILIGEDDALATAIDLVSARFIARIDRYDIFLARPSGFTGICILTRDAGSFELVGAGCSGTEQGRGAISYAVTGSLEVVAGDLDPVTSGVPIPLTESVTAYRS